MAVVEERETPKVFLLNKLFHLIVEPINEFIIIPLCMKALTIYLLNLFGSIMLVEFLYEVTRLISQISGTLVIPKANCPLPQRDVPHFSQIYRGLLSTVLMDITATIVEVITDLHNAGIKRNIHNVYASNPPIGV
ncbi:hypothetical protein [Pseudovibrio brasiliensis]|uniref:RDD family protein n=1 Tax=Pseudovibrio brasiliensis TaxID=1898042 RepID=A0ABX8ALI1_9HYPH|nr:hypothetical protein [Pseudovibrio brasiliensis]QUS54501.1 hypothetical protein KGB56_13985 [Pseudovibrio brasiliensis]